MLHWRTQVQISLNREYPDTIDGIKPPGLKAIYLPPRFAPNPKEPRGECLGFCVDTPVFIGEAEQVGLQEILLVFEDDLEVRLNIYPVEGDPRLADDSYLLEN